MSQGVRQNYFDHLDTYRNMLLSYPINYNWGKKDSYGATVMLSPDADILIDWFLTVLPGAQKPSYKSLTPDEYKKKISQETADLDNLKYDGSVLHFMVQSLQIRISIFTLEYERDNDYFTYDRAKLFIFAKYYTGVALYTDQINRFIRGDFIQATDFNFIKESLIKCFGDQLSLNQIIRVANGIIKYKGILNYKRRFKSKTPEEWDVAIQAAKDNSISYTDARSALDYVESTKASSLEVNKLLFQKFYDYKPNEAYGYYYLVILNEQDAATAAEYDPWIDRINKSGPFGNLVFTITQLFDRVFTGLLGLWKAEGRIINKVPEVAEKGADFIIFLADNIQWILIGGVVIVGYLLYSGTVRVPYVHTKGSDEKSE